MEVILARIDGLRYSAVQLQRVGALRDTFQAASQLLASYFPGYLDRSLRLPAYWAHCEAFVAEDVAAARKVWEEVTLKTGLGRCGLVGRRCEGRLDRGVRGDWIGGNLGVFYDLGLIRTSARA